MSGKMGSMFIGGWSLVKTDSQKRKATRREKQNIYTIVQMWKQLRMWRHVDVGNESGGDCVWDRFQR